MPCLTDCVGSAALPSPLTHELSRQSPHGSICVAWGLPVVMNLNVLKDC